MENTNKLQTDQLLKELNAKNNILTKLLDKNFQTLSLQGSTRQPCNNLEDLHESSPSKCQVQKRLQNSFI